MFRPERMTKTSIICVKQDIEPTLQALSNFGEFHIEQVAEDITIAEYNRSIQKAEEAQVNVNELIKELNREKTGLFDIFKDQQPIKTQVTAENWHTLTESTSEKILTLKKQVEEINNLLAKAKEKIVQLGHTNEVLTLTESMNVDLSAVEDMKLIHVVVARLPSKKLEGLKKSVSDLPVFLNYSALTKELDFVYLAAPSKIGLDVDKILKIHNAEIFVFPKDLPHNANQAIKEVNNRLKENKEKEKAFSDSLNKLSKEYMTSLLSWKETMENILALLNAEKKILQSGRLATIQGFVPKKKFPELSQKVHDMLGEKAIVLEKEPEKELDPPTSLNNNRFVKPFEELTKLYGLPHYDELDPTPIMAITFPILFGLMFGDMGHGLMLFVGGLTLFFVIKKNQSIRNVCWIMATCGLAAIVAGALYGEFFGKEFFKPLWFSPFNPTTNVFSFLIFALVIGVIQITSGLVLEMADFVIKGKIADAIFTSIPRIAFYIGGVVLIVVFGLDLSKWFSGPVLLLVVPFILMVIAKPTYVAATHMSFKSIETEAGDKLSAETHEGSFGQSLFESGDTMTRLLSNTISYSRILALLMAHWALLLVTYTVAGLVGTASIVTLILSGIIIVGGNIFVIALEGLVVFIHTLRLHFYEWFSKFYGGTGTEFSPFKQKNDFTELVLDGKKG